MNARRLLTVPALALALTGCGAATSVSSAPASTSASMSALSYDEDTITTGILYGLGSTTDPQGTASNAAWCAGLATGWPGLHWTTTIAGQSTMPFTLQGSTATIDKACLQALAEQG